MCRLQKRLVSIIGAAKASAANATRGGRHRNRGGRGGGGDEGEVERSRPAGRSGPELIQALWRSRG